MAILHLKLGESALNWKPLEFQSNEVHWMKGIPIIIKLRGIMKWVHLLLKNLLSKVLYNFMLCEYIFNSHKKLVYFVTANFIKRILKHGPLLGMSFGSHESIIPNIECLLDNTVSCNWNSTVNLQDDAFDTDFPPFCKERPNFYLPNALQKLLVKRYPRIFWSKDTMLSPELITLCTHNLIMTRSAMQFVKNDRKVYIFLIKW